LLALLLAVTPAQATELVWQGYYRGRALAFDSLSLSTTNANAEGFSSTIDHRLLLRPSWLISEHAAIHAEVDVMKLSLWGEEPDTFVDPVTGEETAVATTDGVSNTSTSAGVRGWGEAYTTWGRIALGRMPLNWGAGILWNDGNAVDAEYGDTADRIQLSGTIGPVFLMGAWDVQVEGFAGADDDMQSVTLAAGYRSETMGVGLLNNYRYRPEGAETDDPYQAYTGDLWAFAELGAVRAELEGVAVVGGGSLGNGADNVTVTAFGLMAKADYKAEKFGFGAEFGVATGDDDPSDKNLTTFTFDRDHNLGLFLFEEPMPTLAAAVATEANGGRTTAAARSGEGVQNAIYFRPAVRYQLTRELQAEGSWLVAGRADSAGTNEADEGYGNEFDVSLRWDPHPHVWFQGTVGAFLPGPLYSQYTDPDLGKGFDETAVGARLIGTVEF
jgi:hypothetical protein